MDEKISIIVPVYNVEKYLAECIESIINQTYKNIEILLIDDGSNDESLKICNYYSEKDSRIIVIHKENEGLSATRNLGVEKAIGEYITFIDSDDMISLDYIETLYNSIKLHNSDIAVARFCRFKNKEDILKNKNLNNIDNICVNTIQYIKKTLYQCDQTLYSVTACGKLYKITVFKNIKFPVGKLNEDLAIILELEKYSKSIICIDNIKYYYRISNNSITTQKFNEKKLDIVEILYNIKNEIMHDYPELEQAITNLIYSRSADLLRDIKKSKYKNEKIEKELWDNIKKSRLSIISDKHTRKIAKISCIMSYGGRNFFLLMLKIFKRIKYIKNIQ